MSVQLEVELDFSIIGSMSFTLTETGGGGATGSISVSSADGPRFLRSDMSANYLAIDPSAGAGHYADLLSTLKTKLDAVGNATYTVTFNTTTQRITIAGAGGSVTAFALTSFNTVAQQVLGYTSNKSGALTYTADRAPYYWISTTQGGLTGYEWDQEEDSDIAIDHIAHDGSAYGMSKPGAPILFQATVPMEPKEMVQEHFVDSATPYTWQRFFRDTRNVRAYVLRFNDDEVNHSFILRNRSDGALFKPRLSRKDWWDFSDIKLDARVLNSAIIHAAFTWTPAELGSKLQLWLKPSGLSGSPIDTWADNGGSARDFSATSTTRPAAGTLGANNAADFDGSNDYMSPVGSVTLATLIGNGSAYHVVCVYQQDTAAPTGTLPYTSGEAILSDNSGYWSIYAMERSGNKIGVYHYDSGTKYVEVNATLSALQCIEVGKSGGISYARASGTASTTGTGSTATGNIGLGTGAMSIGRNTTGSTFWDGAIGEVIVCNAALTTDEQSNLRLYLAQQWGVNNPGTDLY